MWVCFHNGLKKRGTKWILQILLHSQVGIRQGNFPDWVKVGLSESQKLCVFFISWKSFISWQMVCSLPSKKLRSAHETGCSWIFTARWGDDERIRLQMADITQRFFSQTAWWGQAGDNVDGSDSSIRTRWQTHCNSSKDATCMMSWIWKDVAKWHGYEESPKVGEELALLLPWHLNTTEADST